MRQLFPYGKPVTGDDLIDREEIIGEIVRDVQGGQSLILASPRRYGKSSVVLESLDRLSRMGVLTGYVDLFEKSSLSEFAEGIIEAVLSNQTSKAEQILRMIKTNIGEFLRNIQFKHIWEDNEIVLSLGSKTQDQMALMDEALEYPQKFAQKSGKKMVFAIDEFGELKGWNRDLLKRMRAKFQRHDGVTYIFTGSQESLMKKLFVEKSEAFYGFGKIMGLSPLPLDDLVTYLLNALEQEGFEMDEGTAFYLARKVEGHPHYFKVLAQAVLDRLPREQFTIGKEDVDLGYQGALDQGRGELDIVWSSLSKAPLQRQVLKFLAWEESRPYSNRAFPSTDKSQIYFALTDLERKGILRKTGRGKYTFVNPFFPDYLRRFSKGSF